MDSYEEVVRRFIFQELPTVEVTEEIRFEAISSEIFGTKQRRNGPMPTPERQVDVRRVIREQEVIHFFIPWACRKLADGMNLDILEFCALKQLMCLQHTLQRMNKQVMFTFRLEDLTDSFLFKRDCQIEKYRDTFCALAHFMLSRCSVVLESQMASWDAFCDRALNFTNEFYQYLSGECDVSRLAQIGWKGLIPQEQREYYYRCFKNLYPNDDPVLKLSQYFAATLARVQLNCQCLPYGVDEFIQICFANPVPGSPIGGKRVYYRTIPERYTHQHRAPWNAKGYLVVNDSTNDCCPKSLGCEEKIDLIEATVQIGEATVQADYVIS